MLIDWPLTRHGEHPPSRPTCRGPLQERYHCCPQHVGAVLQTSMRSACPSSCTG